MAEQTRQVTFAVEDYFSCIGEIEKLLESHWLEVGTDRDKIPMDVDKIQYGYLAASGQLHVVVARCAGAVVGYHSSIVKPHLRYKSTLMSFVDVYFLHKDFRRGMTGIKLLKFTEESLKARGVKKIVTSTKLSLDMTPLWKRLGYKPVETVLSKWIGD
jgi:L-amino acid N-acyltransferase YncA